MSCRLLATMYKAWLNLMLRAFNVVKFPKSFDYSGGMNKSHIWTWNVENWNNLYILIIQINVWVFTSFTLNLPENVFLCLNYYENCHSVLFQFICPDIVFWVIIIMAFHYASSTIQWFSCIISNPHTDPTNWALLFQLYP